MTYFEQAVKDGHAQLSGEGRNERVTYFAVNHTERYPDPEEKVRAEFWAELIYRYGYEPGRIGVEVVVPDRTPSDAADLVVFRDDERKRPYAIIECKRDRISDSEFNQAVEQACGNGTWAKFRAGFVGVVAGLTRRFLDFCAHQGVADQAGVMADQLSGFVLSERARRPQRVNAACGHSASGSAAVRAMARAHERRPGAGGLTLNCVPIAGRPGPSSAVERSPSNRTPVCWTHRARSGGG